MSRILAKMDRKLLIVSIIMFLFGLLMIFSASSVRAALSGNPYSVFIKHSITLVICFIVSFFIIITPIKNYKKLAPLALYGIIITLIVLFSYGAVINSARRWLDLGFYSLQPSEFAKTILIVYIAVYYFKYKDSLNPVLLFKPLFYGFIIAMLTFFQPDFGTATIIIGLVALIFLSLPVDKKIKTKAFQIGIGAILIIVLTFMLNGKTLFRQGQIDRLTFLNPCQRYTQSTGYQVCNGFIAINNGGLFGVGLGNSTQKYLYLPAAYTDFIFPVIVEELGLIVGLLIILTYIFILCRILRIANKSYNLMASIIAYGVFVYILLHIIVNLVGVLGLFPLTGAPLPFLSYGGSYVLNLAICLALVQRIEIENNIKQKEKLLKRGKR